MNSRYSEGDHLPADWFDVGPSGEGEYRPGTIRFGCNVTVEDAGNCRHIHAQTPASLGIVVIEGCAFAEFHFKRKMRIYDHEGNLRSEIKPDPWAGRKPLLASG